MDVEGDVTPTMIHSSSNIINVCKSCGESDFLYPSKSEAEESIRHQRQIKEQEEFLKRKLAEEVSKRTTTVLSSPILALGFLAGGAFGVMKVKFSSSPVIDFLVCGLLGLGFTAVAIWIALIIRQIGWFTFITFILLATAIIWFASMWM